MNLTWGCELEFGDIPRWIDIPEHLGSWEYFETDIVNQIEPYYGIASDPFGKDPPFGGEINTKPTKTWAEQIKIIGQIIRYFTELGYPPTISCVQQFHVHVGISKEIVKNIEFMRNIVGYIKDNQHDFVDFTNKFVVDERMSFSAIDFLRENNGRLAPKEMYDSMLECSSVREMMKCDTTGLIDNLLKRYAINLKSLEYNKTIEFRSFRASVNLRELIDVFRICELFVLYGLHGKNKPISQIIKEGNYKFPPFVYDHELFESWEKTKRPNRNADIKTRTQYFI